MASVLTRDHELVEDLRWCVAVVGREIPVVLRYAINTVLKMLRRSVPGLTPAGEHIHLVRVTLRAPIEGKVLLKIVTSS